MNLPRQYPNYEKDRNDVLAFMCKYALGFRSAKHKQDILDCLKNTHTHFTERYLRKLLSDLKHKNQVGSTHTRGYWALVLDTRDIEEIRAAMESIGEIMSRARDMMRDSSRNYEMWELKLNKVEQGQREMSF